MRVTSLLFLLFIGWLGSAHAQSSSAPPLELLFDENFQDNRHAWFTTRAAEWDVQLAGGEYRLDSRQPGGRISWRPVAINATQDYTIEVELSNTTSGGLLWGAASGNDARVFATVAGGVAVGGWQQGRFALDDGGHLTMTAAARPPGDWNTLRIEKHGAQESFFVNGVLAFQQAARPLPGQLLGFQAEGLTTVRVRRLRVWHQSLVKRLPGLPPTLRRERLGPRVNTASHHEGAPVLSPDGQELYFGHRIPPVAGQPQRCDVRMARRQPDGSWGAAEDVGAPINNGGYSCPLGITPDGQRLLLLNQYNKDGSPATSGGCSLASRLANGRWSVPEPVVIPGLPARPDYYYFNLAADGQTIVMAYRDADRPGTSGDLYVSHLSAADGRWSAPASLGTVVNSSGNENSPFLAPDGRTLYFSSEGHPGYGGADLFVTRRLDESWTRWSEPLNLGPGINSAGADACYTLGAAGDYAYLCSAEWPEPLEDIFQVKLPAAARPQPTLLVRGRVLDALTRQPIGTADIYYERLPAGTTDGMAHAAGGTGTYQLVLPGGFQYGFRATAPGYLSVNENVDLTTTAGYGEITRDLVLMPIPTAVAAGSVRLRTAPAATAVPAQVAGVARPAAAPAVVAEEKITLNNVFFEQGKPVLLPGSYPELKRLAQTLKENPTLRIRLEGHTDNQGAVDKNQTLSEQRVAEIRKYLVRQSVAADRLEAVGYGPSRPLAPNDTEASRRRNRRVEFVITSR